MPFLTIFATTTDVGYCEYATIVHPYSIGNGKPWGVADIESSIAIESCRGSTIQGEVKRFSVNVRDRDGGRLKVPHMGWNTVHQTRPHPLFCDIPQDSRFYFVHSYYFAPQNSEIVLATGDYPEPFACIVGRDNVFATQFHTEKSHDAGLLLLRNFLHWNG